MSSLEMLACYPASSGSPGWHRYSHQSATTAVCSLSKVPRELTQRGLALAIGI